MLNEMRIERGILLVGLCLMLITSFGCSMQKSGSKVDATRSDNKANVCENQSTGKASFDKEPLRVDYLTPACAITQPEVYVYKEKRRLYVIQSNVLVRDYPIGLGFHPKGDKERAGDGRTPEGDFVICVKNHVSRYVKSLGLSYPAKRHAEHGLFSGIISPMEYREILSALDQRATPPWNTQLGGAIFIHAGGAHRDWTEGCVALYDSDMEELFSIASVGTRVSIRP